MPELPRSIYLNVEAKSIMCNVFAGRSFIIKLHSEDPGPDGIVGILYSSAILGKMTSHSPLNGYISLTPVDGMYYSYDMPNVSGIATYASLWVANDGVIYEFMYSWQLESSVSLFSGQNIIFFNVNIDDGIFVGFKEKTVIVVE